jgi:monodehydroascorbate reductase (NADH)
VRREGDRIEGEEGLFLLSILCSGTAGKVGPRQLPRAWPGPAGSMRACCRRLASPSSCRLYLLLAEPPEPGVLRAKSYPMGGGVSRAFGGGGGGGPPPSTTTTRSCVFRPGGVVVVGAGNAAGYFAKEWVGLQVGDATNTTLTIIGEEDVLPYERPALSKAFLTNSTVRLPGFHTCVGGGGVNQNEAWYKAYGINVLMSSKAVALELDEKRVILENGSSVEYSTLVLATGSEAIKMSCPGSDLKGVHTLRNVRDGLQLVDAMEECKKRRSVAVVVGGGYIGVEVSSALKASGVASVTVLVPEDHIMARLFTPEIATAYETFLRAKGITIKLNSAFATSLEGEDGHVRTVVLADGTKIDADLVVVGIGGRPRLELVRGQPFCHEKQGVTVDGSMAAAPGIYAIGDIANFPLLMYGGRMTRTEHVAHARHSAAHAVRAIADPSTPPYDYLPYFYSRVFDLSWKFYGDASGECTMVGAIDPMLLALWTDPSGIVAGIFLETRGDELHNELLKGVARFRPTLSRSQLESLKKMTVNEALDSLREILEKQKAETLTP